MTDADVREFRSPETPPSAWRRPVLAFAGMMLLAILLIGGGVLLVGGADEPTADTTPITMTPPTTAAPPTTTALVPPPVDSWRRVGADVMDPLSVLMDITTTPFGLVAVGFTPGDDDTLDGVVLRSEDGITWTRAGGVDSPLTEGFVMIYGVAEGGPGLVAAGLSNEPDESPAAVYPTVWTSTDGTSWTRVRTDGEGSGQYGAILDVIAVDRSEERFSRNAETDLESRMPSSA